MERPYLLIRLVFAAPARDSRDCESSPGVYTFAVPREVLLGEEVVFPRERGSESGIEAEKEEAAPTSLEKIPESSRQEFLPSSRSTVPRKKKDPRKGTVERFSSSSDAKLGRSNVILGAALTEDAGRQRDRRLVAKIARGETSQRLVSFPRKGEGENNCGAGGKRSEGSNV